jgi:hypothetical protein
VPHAATTRFSTPDRERPSSSTVSATTASEAPDKIQHPVARIIARALDEGRFPPAHDYILAHALRDE